MTKFREKSKKPKFWAILGCFGPKFAQKIFFRKSGFSYFEHCHFASLCHKFRKKKTKFREKSKKTQILGHFGPKFAQKNFFSKIGLRHILGIAILHHCAKNQKKLMSGSREKLVTDERTNGQQLIYIGPPRDRSKKRFKIKRY